MGDVDFLLECCFFSKEGGDSRGQRSFLGLGEGECFLPRICLSLRGLTDGEFSLLILEGGLGDGEGDLLECLRCVPLGGLFEGAPWLRRLGGLGGGDLEGCFLFLAGMAAGDFFLCFFKGLSCLRRPSSFLRDLGEGSGLGESFFLPPRFGGLVEALLLFPSVSFDRFLCECVCLGLGDCSAKSSEEPAE